MITAFPVSPLLRGNEVEWNTNALLSSVRSGRLQQVPGILANQPFRMGSLLRAKVLAELMQIMTGLLREFGSGLSDLFHNRIFPHNGLPSC